MMNRVERRPVAASRAIVEYRDGDFKIVQPGSYVLCAVTNQPIPLDELRYWNVDLQEAYSSPHAKLARIGRKLA